MCGVCRPLCGLRSNRLGARKLRTLKHSQAYDSSSHIQNIAHLT